MKTKPKLGGIITAPEFPADIPWLNTPAPLTLRELRGKIVLLDFWTYCCINCMHVLPDLKRLEKEFPELVVIGVHSAKFQNEQDADNIRQAILRYDIEHPVAVDNAFYLWQQYAIKAWPSFALIDPAGKVVGSISGEGVYAQLQPLIKALSAEFAEAGLLDKTPRTFAVERAQAAGGILSYPGKIIADKATGRLLFTDSNHNRIIITDENGNVQEIIGSGVSGQADGSFDAAQFYRPQGLALDAARGILYIADTDNHLLREANLRTRTVTTVLGTGQQATTYLKGGQGSTLALNSPWDVLLLNGQLYIAMAGPHQIWTMNLTTHEATVYAGSGHENLTDGPLLQAALAQTSGLATDGKRIFFADSETSSIRYTEDGQVRTLIGEGLFAFGDVDGAYPAARLQHCIGVQYYEENGRPTLLVADTYNHKIKKLDINTRTLTSWLGTGKRGNADGTAATASLNEPNGIVHLNGKFYITDTNNGLIRVVDEKNSAVSTLELKDGAGMNRLSLLAVKQKSTNKENVPFFGDVATLPTLVQGAEVSIVVPKGYKLNDEAPNYATLADGTSVTLRKEKDRLVVILPKVASDKATLEVGIYYCEEGRNARCLIKQVQLSVPLAAGGASQGSYALPLPK